MLNGITFGITNISFWYHFPFCPIPTVNRKNGVLRKGFLGFAKRFLEQAENANALLSRTANAESRPASLLGCCGFSGRLVAMVRLDVRVCLRHCVGQTCRTAYCCEPVSENCVLRQGDKRFGHLSGSVVSGDFVDGCEGPLVTRSEHRHCDRVYRLAVRLFPFVILRLLVVVRVCDWVSR